ncbi:transcriptional regulator, XRE family [Faunimonas pinastri]|uniref:Transcriptional regulator, XRE family n=1 Tax=Faunimonas pinastri TaxID=1855383 RepID=A0A1H9GT15_9HYPH|nr:helix-turn-helix transcriptional regulator [Faunimonas pinastri]SEQ53195.1 transcriptional regulator, XRE family [Faunimonas pinastri]
MTGVLTPRQRRELGEFVRAQREKCAPEMVGIAPGGRRRTPGLRREEAAQLCGLSVTWYTWIEQGRDVAASAPALARLARALRLSRAERAYLFEIAGRRDPDHDGQPGEPLPEAAAAAVHAISCPAYILDREWNARAWNAGAGRLFPGWLDRPEQPNLLRFLFLEPTARSLIDDWERRARRITAEFRAACGLHPDDRALRAQIEALHRESPEFAQFWAEHGVLAREGGARTFRHPVDGFLRFEQVTFELAGHEDFRLTMLVSPSRKEG